MATDPAETPTLLTLAEGFHVRQAVDNIAWIDLGGWAVVVDALEQPELEEEVFHAIRHTIGQTPIRYVLNTHTHYDHVALNEAFRRRCGAEVIDARAGRIGPEGRWFRGPRRTALMLPLGGCHTEEDAVVWLPQDRALFTGDIFGWGLIPLSGPLNARSADRLMAAYARMIDFAPAVVIPGHGPVCTGAELKRWVEYFRRLAGEVARACSAGADDQEVRRRIPPPEDMKTWWRFCQWKHADSVAKMLQAVRSGWDPSALSR